MLPCCVHQRAAYFAPEPRDSPEEDCCRRSRFTKSRGTNVLGSPNEAQCRTTFAEGAGASHTSYPCRRESFILSRDKCEATSAAEAVRHGSIKDPLRGTGLSRLQRDLLARCFPGIGARGEDCRFTTANRGATNCLGNDASDIMRAAILPCSGTA